MESIVNTQDWIAQHNRHLIKTRIATRLDDESLCSMSLLNLTILYIYLLTFSDTWKWIVCLGFVWNHSFLKKLSFYNRRAKMWPRNGRQIGIRGWVFHTEAVFRAGCICEVLGAVCWGSRGLIYLASPWVQLVLPSRDSATPTWR